MRYQLLLIHNRDVLKFLLKQLSPLCLPAVDALKAHNLLIGGSCERSYKWLCNHVMEV